MIDSEARRTELVFQALAGRTRRRILDLVKDRPGCCVNDLCQHFPSSRIAVMKHLKILVESQLLISQKNGRKREFFFNVAPIQMIYDRWTTEYSAFWATQAVDLKNKIEGRRRADREYGKQARRTPTRKAKATE